MILDDGGDATILVHLGREAEKDASVLDNPGNEEEEALFASIKKRMAEKPGWYTALGDAIRGVTEETTTGVHRLYEMEKKGTLLFPPSTSTTPSPSRSSTISMVAAKASWTAFAGAPT